jgi:hypothetical protein
MLEVSETMELAQSAESGETGFTVPEFTSCCN